jgi:hypothetical protein
MGGKGRRHEEAATGKKLSLYIAFTQHREDIAQQPPAQILTAGLP